MVIDGLPSRLTMDSQDRLNSEHRLNSNQKNKKKEKAGKGLFYSRSLSGRSEFEYVFLFFISIYYISVFYTSYSDIYGKAW